MHRLFEHFKILVCDDSITNVMILKELISVTLSAAVTTVTDPRRVMDVLGEKEHDLLLLDLEMPHLNGFDVLVRVRETWNADKLPVIILTGSEGAEVRRKALEFGANDFINKPFDQTEACLRVKNLLNFRRSFKLHESLNRKLEYQVAERTAQLNSATEVLIHRLARAGEFRDSETGLHVVRVGKYARILAEGIGLPEEAIAMIEKAAPLHDIGKIGIPDHILLKAGKLTPEEFEIMKGHTVYGAELLGQHHSLLVQMAGIIALTHHEKWNGSGYPNGKRGEAIPIEGRICSIADVFDALISPRPYKEPWPLERVVAYIVEEAGRAFDPGLVDVFSGCVEEFMAIKRQHED